MPISPFSAIPPEDDDALRQLLEGSAPFNEYHGSPGADIPPSMPDIPIINEGETPNIGSLPTWYIDEIYEKNLLGQRLQDTPIPVENEGGDIDITAAPSGPVKRQGQRRMPSTPRMTMPQLPDIARLAGDIPMPIEEDPEVTRDRGLRNMLMSQMKSYEDAIREHKETGEPVQVSGTGNVYDNLDDLRRDWGNVKSYYDQTSAKLIKRGILPDTSPTLERYSELKKLLANNATTDSGNKQLMEAILQQEMKLGKPFEAQIAETEYREAMTSPFGVPEMPRPDMQPVAAESTGFVAPPLKQQFDTPFGVQPDELSVESNLFPTATEPRGEEPRQVLEQPISLARESEDTDPGQMAERIGESVENIKQVGVKRAAKQMAGSFVKGLAGGVAGIPESIAIAAYNIEDMIPEWMEVNKSVRGKTPTERDFYKFGQWIRQQAEENFPDDPEQQNNFITQTLAQGAGSMVAFLGSAVAGKAARASELAVTGITGGAMGAAEQYREAKEYGADEATASKAAGMGALGGFTEVIPISRALRTFGKVANRAGQRSVAKAATEILKEGAIESVEEGLQEGFQTTWDNFTAQELYDSSRDLLRGVPEAAVSGGILGFVMGGGTVAAGKMLQREDLSPKERKLVEQAQANFQKATDAQESKQQRDEKRREMMRRFMPREDGAGETPSIVDVEAHEAATSPLNNIPEPTDAQKKAGNYQKAHSNISGLEISIENPEGSVRSGTDEDGKIWRTEMKAHYGYIRRTEGKDGDQVDVFVKPGTSDEPGGIVYVVDQINPKTRIFDEHKALVGYASEEEARKAYMANYEPNWLGLGAITGIPMDEFKTWVKSGDTKKPINATIPITSKRKHDTAPLQDVTYAAISSTASSEDFATFEEAKAAYDEMKQAGGEPVGVVQKNRAGRNITQSGGKTIRNETPGFNLIREGTPEWSLSTDVLKSVQMKRSEVEEQTPETPAITEPQTEDEADGQKERDEETLPEQQGITSTSPKEEVDTIAPGASQTPGVITAGDRQALTDLGYSMPEIEQLTDQDVRDIVDQGLQNPAIEPVASQIDEKALIQEESAEIEPETAKTSVVEQSQKRDTAMDDQVTKYLNSGVELPKGKEGYLKTKLAKYQTALEAGNTAEAVKNKDAVTNFMLKNPPPIKRGKAEKKAKKKPIDRATLNFKLESYGYQSAPLKTMDENQLSDWYDTGMPGPHTRKYWSESQDLFPDVIAPEKLKDDIRNFVKTVVNEADNWDDLPKAYRELPDNPNDTQKYGYDVARAKFAKQPTVKESLTVEEQPITATEEKTVVETPVAKLDTYLASNPGITEGQQKYLEMKRKAYANAQKDGDTAKAERAMKAIDTFIEKNPATAAKTATVEQPVKRKPITVGKKTKKQLGNDIVQFTNDLLGSLGIDKDVELYVPGDVTAKMGKDYPGLAKIKNRRGGVSIRKGGGSYVIAISPYGKTRLNLEVIAHEVGHIVQQEHFDNAPQETRDAIITEFENWVKQQKGKSFGEIQQNLRTYSLAKQQAGQVFTAETKEQQEYYDKYITSFKEWFADQVAKWATTDDSPTSVVDKFFKRLADALRAVVAKMNNTKYAPNTKVKEFMQDIVNFRVNPETAQIEVAETNAETQIQPVTEVTKQTKVTNVSEVSKPAPSSPIERARAANKERFDKIRKRLDAEGEELALDPNREVDRETLALVMDAAAEYINAEVYSFDDFAVDFLEMMGPERVEKALPYVKTSYVHNVLTAAPELKKNLTSVQDVENFNIQRIVDEVTGLKPRGFHKIVDAFQGAPDLDKMLAGKKRDSKPYKTALAKYNKAVDAIRTRQDVQEALTVFSGGTQALYQREGKYIRARKLLHDEIVANHLENVPASKNSEIVVVYGDPAAGKSAALKMLELHDSKDHVFANADEIKYQLPEAEPLFGLRVENAVEALDAESRDIQQQVLDEAQKGKKNVIWSEVNPSAQQLKSWKDAGYTVRGVLVNTAPEAALGKAQAIFDRFGLFHSGDQISADNTSSRDIFFEQREGFDATQIIDNAPDGMKIVLDNNDIIDYVSYNKILGLANAQEAGQPGRRGTEPRTAATEEVVQQRQEVGGERAAQGETRTTEQTEQLSGTDATIQQTVEGQDIQSVPERSETGRVPTAGRGSKSGALRGPAGTVSKQIRSRDEDKYVPRTDVRDSRLVSEGEGPSTSKNYKFDRDTPIRMTRKERFDANMAALRILNEKADFEITETDRAALAQYTGWGGLGEYITRPEVQSELDKMVGSAARVRMESSVTNAHYTDYPIINFLYDKLSAMGVKGGYFMEPGSGIGNFAGIAPEGYEFDLVEIEPIAARVSNILHPEFNTFNTGLEAFGRSGYDGVIGNVPFGNYTLPLRKNDPYRKLDPSIHNYFILRGLDALEANGMMGIITSTGTLDGHGKKTEEIRRLMNDRAEFVGAYRLPAQTFDKNATTKVTTDVLFFRKREIGEDFTPQEEFIKSSKHTIQTAQGKDVEVYYSDYFAAHPENVLGEMLAGYNALNETQIGVRNEKSADEIIADLQKKIKDGMKPSMKPREAGSARVSAENENGWIPAPTERMIGTMTVGKTAAGQDVLYRKNAQGMYEPIVAPKSAMERLTLAVPLMDKVNLALDRAVKEQDTAALRKEIVTGIEAYMKKFGIPREDRKLTEYLDDNPDKYKLLNLVDKNGDRLGFLDTGKLYTADYTVQIADVNNLKDVGRYVYLSNGHLDLKQMAEMYRGGISESALKKELDSSKEFFYNPESNYYEPANVYLSGNVYKKIDAASSVMENDKRMVKNIEALSESKPVTVPMNEIDLDLRIGYIPLDMMREWLGEKLGVSQWQRKNIEISVNLDHDLSRGEHSKLVERAMKYTVKVPRGASYNNNELGWGGKKYSEILKKYLNNSSFRASWAKNATPQQIEAAKKEAEVNTKRMSELNEDMKNWLLKPEQMAQAADIELEWNKRYNAYKIPEYTGADVHIPDISSTFYGEPTSIHPWHFQIAERFLYNGKYLNAHGVGAGKTVSSILVAHLGKKRGYFKKPLISAPAKTLGKWHMEYQMLFPDANIINLSNLPKAKRDDLLVQAAFSDADAILISDHVLKEIPLSPEVMSEMLAQDWDNAKKAAQITLAVKNPDIVEMTERQFDQYIQGIMYDHERYQQEVAAYSTNPAGKKKPKKPDSLKDQLTFTFAKFLTNLNNKLQQAVNDAQSATGAIYFDHIGVDAVFADEFHNYKNIPTWSSSGLDIPGVNNDDPSAGAVDFQYKSRFIMEKMDNRNINGLSATPMTNSPAEIYNMIKLIAPEVWTDQNIYSFDNWLQVYSKVEDRLYKNSKQKHVIKPQLVGFKNLRQLQQAVFSVMDFRSVEELVQMLPEDAREGFIPEAANELILCEPSDELQTYNEYLLKRASDLEEAFRHKEPIDDSFRAITNDGRRAAVDLRAVGITPKSNDRFDKLINNTVDAYFEFQKTKGTQIIFTDLINFKDADTGERTGNIHTEIRDALVARGIPEKEIEWASSKPPRNNSIEDKKRLQDDFNLGKIRVLMGSTTMIGEGMNLQERTTDIHNYDAPWKPSQLEQRGGRGVRQGNMNEKVRIRNYITFGSFDEQVFQKLQQKKNWIFELFRTNRDEEAVEDAIEMNFTEVLGALVDGTIKDVYEAKNREELTRTEYEISRAITSKLDASVAKTKAALEVGKRWKQAYESMKKIDDPKEWKKDKSSTPYDQRYTNGDFTLHVNYAKAQIEHYSGVIITTSIVEDTRSMEQAKDNAIKNFGQRHRDVDSKLIGQNVTITQQEAKLADLAEEFKKARTRITDAGKLYEEAKAATLAAEKRLSDGLHHPKYTPVDMPYDEWTAVLEWSQKPTENGYTHTRSYLDNSGNEINLNTSASIDGDNLIVNYERLRYGQNEAMTVKVSMEEIPAALARRRKVADFDVFTNGSDEELAVTSAPEDAENQQAKKDFGKGMERMFADPDMSTADAHQTVNIRIPVDVSHGAAVQAAATIRNGLNYLFAPKTEADKLLIGEQEATEYHNHITEYNYLAKRGVVEVRNEELRRLLRMTKSMKGSRNVAANTLGNQVADWYTKRGRFMNPQKAVVKLQEFYDEALSGAGWTAMWVKMDDNDNLVFGGRQKWGVLSKQQLKMLKKNGIELAEGMTLDGLEVGEMLEDGSVQLYRSMDPTTAEENYRAFTQKFPEAVPYLHEYIKAETKLRHVDMLGKKVPLLPFNRNAMNAYLQEIDPEFEGVDNYVHGLAKKRRKALSTTRALLKKRTPDILKHNRGILSAMESRDYNLSRAQTQARMNYLTSMIKTEQAGVLLALVAKPYGGKNQPLIPGYKPLQLDELSMQQLRNLFNRTRAFWEAKGVPVNEVISGTYQLQKRWQIPVQLEDELVGVLKAKPENFANPTLAAFMRTASNFFNAIINSINATHLIRPGTAATNYFSGELQIMQKTLQDAFYVGLTLGTSNDAWIEFKNDLTVMLRRLSPRARRQWEQVVPKEVFDRNFYADMGNLSGEEGVTNKLLIPFQAIEVIFKARVWDMALHADAEKKAVRDNDWELLTADQKRQRIIQYANNPTPEMISRAQKISDEVTYDYANIPRWLANLKKKVLFRSILPYPTYFYKFFSQLGRGLWGATGIIPDSMRGDEGTVRGQLGLKKLGPNSEWEADSKVLQALGNIGYTPDHLRMFSNFLATSGLILTPMLLIQGGDDEPDDPRFMSLGKYADSQGNPYSDYWADYKFDMSNRLMAHETDKAYYYLRAIKYPWIREAMALSQMNNEQWDWGNYFGDLISEGSLFSLGMHSVGLADKYNKNKPFPARIGETVASDMPFAPYLNDAAIFIDPKLREKYNRDAGFVENLAIGFAHKMPFLSMLTNVRRDPQTGAEIEIPRELTFWNFVTGLRFKRLIKEEADVREMFGRTAPTNPKVKGPDRERWLRLYSQKQQDAIAEHWDEIRPDLVNLAYDLQKLEYNIKVKYLREKKKSGDMPEPDYVKKIANAQSRRMRMQYTIEIVNKHLQRLNK